MCWYHFSFFFGPPLISRTMAFSSTTTLVITTLSPGLATNPFSAINCATCASLGVTTPCLITRPLCPMGKERRAKQCSAVRSRISNMRVCGVILSDDGVAGFVSSAQTGSASSKAAAANNETRGRFMGIPGLLALYAQSSCALSVETLPVQHFSAAGYGLLPFRSRMQSPYAGGKHGYTAASKPSRTRVVVQFGSPGSQDTGQWLSSRASLSEGSGRADLCRCVPSVAGGKARILNPTGPLTERQPLACGLEVERLSATFTNGVLHALPRAFLNQGNNAASSSRTANLCRPCAVLLGHSDQFVDERRGDAWRVRAPQLPFFAQQAFHVVPLPPGERAMHGLRNARNLLKVANHLFIPIDVLLQDLPVVNPRLSRRSGVEKRKALVHFIE